MRAEHSSVAKSSVSSIATRLYTHHSPLEREDSLVKADSGHAYFKSSFLKLDNSFYSNVQNKLMLCNMIKYKSATMQTRNKLNGDLGDQL